MVTVKLLYDWVMDDQPIVRADQIEPMLDLAIQHKLFPTIYSLLAQTGWEPEPHHHTYYQRYVKARQRAIFTLRQLLEKKDERTTFLLLKGLGVEQYYEKKQRHFLDLDLCAKDLESFWDIGKSLLTQGLDLYSTMNLYSADDQEIYGSARFEEEEFEESFQGVEVQISHFPISPRTYIPWEVLAHNMDVLEIDGLRVPVPSREGSLIILLAEILTRPEKIHLRDVIDLMQLIAGDGTELDEHWLATQIDSIHLQPALSRLSHWLNENQIEAPTSFQRFLGKVGSSLTGERKGLFTGHIVPFCRQHSTRPLRDLLFQSLRQYSYQLNDENRFLPFLKKTDELIGPTLFYRNRVHVYFMKVSPKSGNYAWSKLDHYHLLTTPIGTFVACMHALYSDDELDYLATHLT